MTPIIVNNILDLKINDRKFIGQYVLKGRLFKEDIWNIFINRTQSEKNRCVNSEFIACVLLDQPKNLEIKTDYEYFNNQNIIFTDENTNIVSLAIVKTLEADTTLGCFKFFCKWKTGKPA